MIAHDNPRRRWPVLLGLIMLLTFGQGRAAWFAKFDGVDGELTEGQFAGWTSLQSVGALVSRPDPTNAASFSCEIRKAIDRTSPALLQRCGEGEPSQRVTPAWVLTQPPATQYRITLENVRVSSVAHKAGSPETIAPETVALTFDKVEMTCFELDASGGTTGGLTALFDQTTAQGRLKTRPPFRATITRQDGRSGMLVTWPAEIGHRYRIFTRPTLAAPWSKLFELTASEDGPASQFVPTDTPSLLMRVEEIE